MPPGLGVLRGPAAPTQPEPRRERPQPAQLEGSDWGFSWIPTACASEEAGVCAAAFSGGISLLQEDQIRVLGEFFFF